MSKRAQARLDAKRNQAAKQEKLKRRFLVSDSGASALSAALACMQPTAGAVLTGSMVLRLYGCGGS
eukprot:COSAG02_NODE_16226_length_1102_cov_0.684945_1_plen_66_part_00